MRSRPLVARFAVALLLAATSSGLGQTRQTDLDDPRRQVPALRDRRVPRHGGPEDGHPRAAARAGAFDGRRQARAHERLGRARGRLPEGRRRGPGLQVPGLGRGRRADDLPVRVPAVRRAGDLQAPAESRRPGRARRRRGGHRPARPRGRDAVLAGHGARPRRRRCRPPRPSSSRTRPSAPRRGRAARS